MIGKGSGKFWPTIRLRFKLKTTWGRCPGEDSHQKRTIFSLLRYDARHSLTDSNLFSPLRHVRHLQSGINFFPLHYS